MTESEIMQRLIGVLVEASHWRDRLEAGDEPDMTNLTDVIQPMMSEILSTVRVEVSSADAEGAAIALGEEVFATLNGLMSSFVRLWINLATANDQRADVTTAEVLQRMATRAASGEFDA